MARPASKSLQEFRPALRDSRPVHHVGCAGRRRGRRSKEKDAHALGLKDCGCLRVATDSDKLFVKTLLECLNVPAHGLLLVKAWIDASEHWPVGQFRIL